MTLGAGVFVLSGRVRLELDAAWPAADVRAVAERLQAGARVLGVRLERGRKVAGAGPGIRCVREDAGHESPEFYSLKIDAMGIEIAAREVAGLRAGVATLRQLWRAQGRRLPVLRIRDWPDFARRGNMLDVSRGRVPNLASLLDLADRLADFKFNELQLYTEHTFAYRGFKPVWESWGALTGGEMRRLDAHCRRLGIDLVPNQNSFGHLREWLAHLPLKELAEVDAPYEGPKGKFLRYPSTLDPRNPGTLKFVGGLFDELLPNFSSGFFNVGCDETWDLGRGRSRAACERQGKGRVYLDFLKQIHGAVRRRGRTMMFWGDIILNHPELIAELPKEVIALNWGYEATHPFEREAALFAKSKIPFYVCPGTSTWMTLVGKHDNALANLRRAARAGRRHGARGYLITDWGDGGHPQPPAVSWPALLAGAALGWCAATFAETELARVLDRDVYGDAAGRMGAAALGLGLAHGRLKFTAPNETPLGTVITAPPPERRELFCRHGLTHFNRLAAGDIRSARAELRRQLARLERARPVGVAGEIFRKELRLAARLAGMSCDYMLWQQARAGGRRVVAETLAVEMVRELRAWDKEFNALWPVRNKATPEHCTAFVKWRLEELQSGK